MWVVVHLCVMHLTELKQSLKEEVAAFELVDILTSSAQNVVHMICESIASRVLASPERSRRPTINPNL